MTLLGRLIATEVIKNTAYVLVLLTSVFALFDTILGVSSGEYVGLSFEVILLKTLLRSPRSIYELLPLSSLTGTLLTFARLSINSEFAVMRIAGMSYEKISKTLGFTALVVIAFTMLIGEIVKPMASRALTKLSLSDQAGELIVQTFQSGAWFKDQNRIINARYISEKYDMRGVSVYELDSNDRSLKLIISSAFASLSEDGVWTLDDVSITEFHNGQVIKSEVKKLDVKTSITRSVVSLVATDQEALSSLELSKHIEHLELNGEDAYFYRAAWWERIGHLGIIFTLILIGPVFVGINNRGRQLSFWVFNGVLAGIAIYFLTQLIGALGNLGRVTPVFYTLLPLVFTLFVVAMFVKFKGE